MEAKETVQKLMETIVYNYEQERKVGGQSCGMPVRCVSAAIPGLDIKVSIGVHNIDFENKKLAKLLVEMALIDLIK